MYCSQAASRALFNLAAMPQLDLCGLLFYTIADYGRL